MSCDLLLVVCGAEDRCDFGQGHPAVQAWAVSAAVSGTCNAQGVVATWAVLVHSSVAVQCVRHVRRATSAYLMPTLPVLDVCRGTAVRERAPLDAER